MAVPPRSEAGGEGGRGRASRRRTTLDPEELFHVSPFHGWLGCRVERMDAEAVVLVLPFREEFTGDPAQGTYHGGILGALADAAATFAAIAAIGRDCVTVDLRIDFLRPARGALTARGRTVKEGRRICRADVEIEDEGGTRVALCRATLAVPAE